MTTEFLIDDVFEKMVAGVNADAVLVERGRYVHADMLIGLDHTYWSLTITAGQIVRSQQLTADDSADLPNDVAANAFLLQASKTEWQQFWLAAPPPGSHDIFALLKRRVLSMHGQLHPFMANMMYFKRVLAMPRVL